MSGPLQFSPNEGKFFAPFAGGAGKVILRADDADEEDDDYDPSVDNVAASRGAPLRAPARPKRVVAKVAPVDVVKLAKRRLREVERDLRRMKRLETERDQLRRLIDAAESKPRAVVTAISKRPA